MRALLLLSFLMLLTNCNTTSKIFDSGQAELKNNIETIELDYISDMPFVKVNIEGKTYNFLFDTGAPTVISSQIFQDLGLKKKAQGKVTDSQKNSKQQIFTLIPEMHVGAITFHDIGAIVLDFESPEFKCLQMDGILGANQMAKLFWRIDYSKRTAEATKTRTSFMSDRYQYELPFTTKDTKTPVIATELFNRKLGFTFDTGYSGFLSTIRPTDLDQYDYISYKGSKSVGAFGTSKQDIFYQIKADDFKIHRDTFRNIIVETGASNLIGNKFLKNFVFILDWWGNKVYLDAIGTDLRPSLKTYGFSYRFYENHPIISSVVENSDSPLQIGDIILQINNRSFENLNEEASCKYMLHRIENDTDSIHIKVKRNNEVSNFVLHRQEYFKF
ncbi:hypothetical protein E2P86_03105 [Sphingobacterium psychroaquaticum]|uniref:aspartyl protease family protein n=1 Tax=Sphingobacterium psychroaquaticum TaxID=561061 RepID=UPI00106BD77D|nr:aspartyl protease family protein [Sphingobacterium psychroaquaticum]QBQ40189.1 hypothetical protein E2P86_03105 [Sphingobacterium psychroaquaticum]